MTKELYCSECGVPLGDLKTSGWYYCPICDDMKYFINGDDN